MIVMMPQSLWEYRIIDFLEWKKLFKRATIIRIEPKIYILIKMGKMARKLCRKSHITKIITDMNENIDVHSFSELYLASIKKEWFMNNLIKTNGQKIYLV